MATSDVQGREAANVFDTSLFSSAPYLINCSILPTVSPKQISNLLASLQLYYDHTSPVIISHLYHYHLLNLNSMLKILQVRLQQYMNHELPGVQAGLEKAEEPEIKLPTSIGSQKNQESFRKTSTFALLTMWKPLTVWITKNCGKFWKRWEYQTTWPAPWEICMQSKKQQLELDMEQTGSKLRKE